MTSPKMHINTCTRFDLPFVILIPFGTSRWVLNKNAVWMSSPNMTRISPRSSQKSARQKRAPIENPMGPTPAEWLLRELRPRKTKKTEGSSRNDASPPRQGYATPCTWSAFAAWMAWEGPHSFGHYHMRHAIRDSQRSCIQPCHRQNC